MGHLRQFSESCLIDRSNYSAPPSHHQLIGPNTTIPDYHPLWVPRRSKVLRPIPARSSFEFPSRGRKGSMKFPILGSFLGATLEEEEGYAVSEDAGVDRVRLTKCRSRTSKDDQLKGPQLKRSHSRSSSGLKILIKKLSRSFVCSVPSEPELSVPIHPPFTPPFTPSTLPVPLDSTVKRWSSEMKTRTKWTNELLISTRTSSHLSWWNKTPALVQV
ncbi:hypothetical protein PCASD_12628 [Puccinia coronata f. sp. avenae]|uniref:Uncharacterized protein n=1 Tax=Puccinia coronata f. sp. avenae TaxID=200324 RepID=A0A2N5TE45_9BASI|nr:hypothetical protein PCASD_12628 [Puccinia coronata f. sp. avenae]